MQSPFRVLCTKTFSYAEADILTPRSRWVRAGDSRVPLTDSLEDLAPTRRSSFSGRGGGGGRDIYNRVLLCGIPADRPHRASSSDLDGKVRGRVPTTGLAGLFKNEADPRVGRWLSLRVCFILFYVFFLYYYFFTNCTATSVLLFMVYLF